MSASRQPRQQQQQQQQQRQKSRSNSFALSVEEFVEGIDGEKLYHEDDEYTPNWWVLLFVSLVVLAVGAGVGVGIWQAVEKKNADDEARNAVGQPTPQPTMAPTITSAPSTEDEKFVCNICGTVTNVEFDNPLAEITVPIPSGGGSETTTDTCQDWYVLGQRGAISRRDCVLFLPGVVEPCGCQQGPTASPTVSPAPTMAPVSLAPTVAPVSPAPTSNSTITQCYICGDDGASVIENPDGTIAALGFEVTCAQLDVIGLNGQIPPGQCGEALFNAVETNCGCVPATR